MLYHGTLAGIPLLICPNEIAGVKAEQSRHQLAFRVADLASLLARAKEAGGSIETPVTESTTSAILRDPDGNTVEVTQA
jgi:predicted enzyme related to lactoylglutathione lyase